jgi:hypothetical protein
MLFLNLVGCRNPILLVLESTLEKKEGVALFAFSAFEIEFKVK